MPTALHLRSSITRTCPKQHRYKPGLPRRKAWILPPPTPPQHPAARSTQLHSYGCLCQACLSTVPAPLLLKGGSSSRCSASAFNGVGTGLEPRKVKINKAKSLELHLSCTKSLMKEIITPSSVCNKMRLVTNRCVKRIRLSHMKLPIFNHLGTS